MNSAALNTGGHIYHSELWFFSVYMGFPDRSVGKESTCMQETPVQFLGQEDPLEKGYRLPTPVFLGFPGGSAGKESACSTGDPGSIPGSERSPGEGNGNPLHYSCLGNPMDRGD